jgi:hypothetical protein
MSGLAIAEPSAPRAAIGCCPHCGRRPVRQPGLAAFVLAWIEDEFGFGPHLLRSGRQTTRLTEARCLATWALRSLGEPMPQAEIARLMGTTRRPRTASAVRHWAARAEELRATSPQFARWCDMLAADVAAREMAS